MSIYLIDKQSGITSNKALSLFKQKENVTKAGFSGVLDPFATGLLIVATDGDTKFLDLFLNSSKTYEGTMLFGKATDTLDTDGEVTEEVEGVDIIFPELIHVIQDHFIGRIEQIPPKHSNIKVDGKRAHELTRKDIDFELKPVTREVISFEVSQLNGNEFKFKVEVSSGTYIRSLARDIGEYLGVPAMLTSLRRVSIGDINVPEDIIKVNREDIIPIPFKNVSDNIITDILNGKEVNIDSEDNELIINDANRCVWVKKKESGLYKIHKNIE